MQSKPSSPQARATGPLFNWLAVITFVYLILVAVGAVSHGFKGFSGGAEGAAQIFAFANNPFVALLLGILATALVQSSSTVTSVIVGLVAGGLPMSMAIPMVMGANLGTTITNTIVSLGHIRDRGEFRRAFAAATVHDFFNLLAVFIFLPLELMFGLLQKSAEWLSGLLLGSADMSMKGMDFMKPLISRPWISSTAPSPSCRARAPPSPPSSSAFCSSCSASPPLARCCNGSWWVVPRSCCTRRWAVARSPASPPAPW